MAYTDEQKAEALKVYQEHGLAEAHRRSGAAKATILGWADRAAVPKPEHSEDRTKAAVEEHVRVMGENRRRIRTQLADTVGFLLARIQTSEKPGPAQQDAIAVGILVDKLSVVGWGDAQAAETGGNADLDRMREEARRRGRALVAV